MSARAKLLVEEEYDSVTTYPVQPQNLAQTNIIDKPLAYGSHVL